MGWVREKEKGGERERKGGRERETVCGSEGGKVKRKRERTMGGEQTREKECVSVSA